MCLLSQFDGKMRKEATMKKTTGTFLAAALIGTLASALHARDADLVAFTLAAAQTSKKCVNLCRARYRDCQSLKQLPSFECRSVYQDCTRLTCNGLTD